jgi:hypothetical protein
MTSDLLGELPSGGSAHRVRFRRERRAKLISVGIFDSPQEKTDVIN